MNYGKLQLSFILLLIMTVIQLLTACFILKKTWLICTSIVAMLLCLTGLIYAIRQESANKNKK